jgi:hypothetical protein
MGCTIHAFSVIHSARSTGQAERSLRSRTADIKSFLAKAKKVFDVLSCFASLADFSSLRGTKFFESLFYTIVGFTVNFL